VPELRRVPSGRPEPHILLRFLRRCLWYLTQLLVATLLVFTTTGRSQSGSATPMFVNSDPVFVSSRAWQLVVTIGRDDEAKPQATLELMRLGGAALPHILPKLDSLEPGARKNLLLALAPLAVRMQLTQTPPSAGESETLWLSFWNDHFVDFHSAMARRVVRRFVQGPTAPRAQEVRRLDTFALGELIRELTRLARDRAPPSGAKPVVDLLCSIATEPNTPCFGRNGHEDTRSMAESWRAWWLREHHRFESPNGAERFLSPILQTEYANWVRTSARAVLTGRGFRVFPWLTCLLTTLQFGVAIACALWVARVFDRLSPQRWLLFALPCLTIPIVLVLGLGGWSSLLGYGGVGAVAGVALGLWARLYQQTLPANGSALGAIYPHVAHLLGVVLTGEGLSRTDGLGSHLFAALRSRDLEATVWTALGCTVLAALGHGLTETIGVRRLTQKEVSP
jgi:hypothetical protein